MFRLLVIIAALSASLMGCVRREHRNPQAQSPEVISPRITELQAGVIATNLCRERKMQLERYDLFKVRFEEGQRAWRFLYVLKPPGMPGGHFWIIVDEEGRADYMGGL